MNADSDEMERSQPEEQGPAVHFFIGGVHRDDWITTGLIFVVAALVLYASTARWPDTPDGLFHLQRVRALSEALRAGILYPRWFPDFAFEYGHPILNYYAPAFYYPPALFHLAGASAITATRLTLALLFSLSGFAMFALLRTWIGIPSALAGAVIYLAFPYRLYDLFIRGALPEFAAFLWLPLLILAAAQISRLSLAKARRTQRISINPLFAFSASLRETLFVSVAASLAWTGLIVTHNLTALMAGLTIAVVLIVVGLVSGRLEILGCVLCFGSLSVLLGLLLAAWYVIPAVAETQWVGIGTEPVSYGYLNHFTQWRELFDWSLIYSYPGAAEPTVPVSGWVALLFLIGLAMLPLARRWSLTMPLAAGLVVTLGSLWMTTASSEWLWTATAPVLGKLQFPWRWQSITALGVALLAGISLEVAMRTFSRRSRYPRDVAQPPERELRERHATSVTYGWPAWIAFLVVAGLVVFNATAGIDYPPAPYGDAELTKEQMWAFDAQFGQVGMTWAGEFLPRWVEEQRWAIGHAPSDGSSAAGLPGVAATVTPRQLGYLSAIYDVDANEATTLIWHRFYFPGWQVQIDGVAAETEAVSNLGLLSAKVSAGTHQVSVHWQPTAATWAGRVVALLAWMLVLATLIFFKTRWRWIVGWLVLGIVGLVVMTTPLERQVVPTVVGADFGTVRLEAASTQHGRVGEAAPVRLHWLVTQPSLPLTAFIHVLDETDTVVAQQDAPLAGAYTPSARWLPGLLIDHTHEIALPADLRPGTYALKAGVYEPGQPGQPLIPAGQSDPRIDIGVLEVRE